MASCARYRTSFTVPELLEPDAIYEIRCGPRRVFLPGHRIRLEVSSSNFPRFDRNSNTGEEIASEAAGQYRPAINRIFHDAAHDLSLGACVGVGLALLGLSNALMWGVAISRSPCGIGRNAIGDYYLPYPRLLASR